MHLDPKFYIQTHRRARELEAEEEEEDGAEKLEPSR